MVSKATTQNPKDLQGNKKPPLSACLPIADAHYSLAMLYGELIYGFRNWRSKKVVARIYIDAAKRHLDSWGEMEEIADDSGVHHLGHAMACCAILLDAMETGNLIDDREKGVFVQVCDKLKAQVAVVKQKAAERIEAMKGAQTVTERRSTIRRIEHKIGPVERRSRNQGRRIGDIQFYDRDFNR